MDSEWHIRKEMIEIGKRVYDKGFVAATDGNLSHRLSGDRVLITPSGFCLGEMQPTDLAVVNMTGRLLTAPHQPTSELPLHLTAYRNRPDINAVVHAHPPTANAFSFAGESLEQVSVSTKRFQATPMAHVFRAGIAEFEQVRRGRSPTEEGSIEEITRAEMGLENVQRALRQAATSEVNRLTKFLSFLATTGSTAPFIAIAIRRAAQAVPRQCRQN